MTQKAVLLVLAAVGLAGACAETRRSVGEDCLKSQDCLSGICSQLVCIASPPTTDVQADANVPEEAAPAEAGPSDAGAPEEAEAAPAEAGSDGAPEAAGD